VTCGKYWLFEISVQTQPKSSELYALTMNSGTIAYESGSGTRDASTWFRYMVPTNLGTLAGLYRAVVIFLWWCASHIAQC